MELAQRIKQEYKPARHIRLEPVINDMLAIAKDLASPGAWQQSSYRLHLVPVNGEKYVAADAKALNRQLNSSGRGNLRLLYDPKTRQPAYLAEHSGDNKSGYRILV